MEDFILPDIGEGIVECELVEWLVGEGDEIEEDQPVADVMTDKALVQIPAMHSGKVVKLYYAKGEIAKVHAPLFAIERISDGNVMPSTTMPVASKNEPAKASPAEKSATNAQATTPVKAKEGNSKAIASPAVRRVARELGVNIHQVPGSGKKAVCIKKM